jgi:hypothetical protein
MDKSIDFEGQRIGLTRRAWWVTGAYATMLLVLCAFVILGEEGVGAFRKMSPSEVGDLLAGLAGPVAFIWLVYGYFLQGIAIRQQAQELAYNTRALHLQEEALRAQAQELKNSVEQQRDLVDVARRQAEAAMAAVQYEMERDSNTARPIFILEMSRVSPYRSAHSVLAATPGTKLSPQYLVEATLCNQGNVAMEVCPTAENFQAMVHPKKIPSMHNGARTTISFVIEPENDARLCIKIEYRDASNRHGKQFFDLNPRYSEDGKLQWLESSKLD